MTIEQRLDLECDDRRHEGTQARLSGRLKFNFCHQCGSIDRMQAVHRETIERMGADQIISLAPWYSAPREPYYLFCVCQRCNRDRVVPAGYELMSQSDVLYWSSHYISMAPDYAALAESEPVLAGQDSHESAGLEG